MTRREGESAMNRFLSALGLFVLAAGTLRVAAQGDANDPIIPAGDDYRGANPTFSLNTVPSAK
jgi:hypothetical protein